MTDHHIHIGQFYEKYYDSHSVFEAISKAADEYGINEVHYSSTSSCRYDVELCKIEEEIEWAKKYNSSILKVQPYFWLTPNYIRSASAIEKTFEKFDYCGIKIHPVSHKWDFRNKNQRKILEKVFLIGKDRQLKVLLHTGIQNECNPFRFEKFIAEFPELFFILAHSTPLKEVKKLIDKYNNVFCDVAFCPKEYVEKVLKILPFERILFGTDFPVTHYWNPEKTTLTDQYKTDCEVLELLNKKGSCINV